MATAAAVDLITMHSTYLLTGSKTSRLIWTSDYLPRPCISRKDDALVVEPLYSILLLQSFLDAYPLSTALSPAKCSIETSFGSPRHIAKLCANLVPLVIQIQLLGISV